MRRLLLFVFIFSYVLQSSAQNELPPELSSRLQNAATDSAKFFELQKISDYYFALKNETAGDSIINIQMMLAYESGKQHWILKVLFGNAGFNFDGKSTKQRNSKTQEYIQRALDYAKTNALKEYEAIASARQAEKYLLEGKKNEALQTAQFGLATAMNTDNDSAKVLCQLMVGNVYLQKGDMLMAFKSYTYAIDIADKSRNIYLKTQVLHAFAFMYKNKLQKYEVSKQYAFQSVSVNKKNNDVKGLINDYILLGKLFDYRVAKKYLFRAETLADSIGDYAGKIEAQRILFFYMLLEEKPAVTFAYVNNHPDMKGVFENTGPHFMDYMRATVYSYGGMIDSALVCFRAAEESFKKAYDPVTKTEFFYEYTNCLLKQKDSSIVIPYAEELYQYSKDVLNYNYMLSAGNILQKLYEQKEDYKTAYNYSLKSTVYKDSIELMAREKDVALMEIDNVNKKRLADEELANQQKQRSHNLQYLAITVIIATIFLLMIIIGMFKVSKITIRAMGFLSLIFLFEFIVLLLDNWIHNFTHGEPWKVWLIKIGIISILLPLHHSIEEKLVHYLLSKKLILLRSWFNIANLKKFIKKSPPAKIPEGDEASKAEATANAG